MGWDSQGSKQESESQRTHIQASASPNKGQMGRTILLNRESKLDKR